MPLVSITPDSLIPFISLDTMAFPFINKSHYVYNNVIYKILPIMDDEDTALIYQDFILNLSTISAYPEEDFQKNC